MKKKSSRPVTSQTRLYKYIVRRYLVEEYEVIAENLSQARMKSIFISNPNKLFVQKETIRKVRTR
jgi:hypothetical protein